MPGNHPGPWQLQYPGSLFSDLSAYTTAALGRPTDFSAVDRPFSSLFSNPMFMNVGGQLQDPGQVTQMAGPSWLAARGGTAAQDIQNRMDLAGLGTAFAGDIGQMSNEQIMLEALRKRMEASGGGLFSGLLGSMLK